MAAPLRVSCLPKNIPDHVELNVEHLEINRWQQGADYRHSLEPTGQLLDVVSLQ